MAAWSCTSPSLPIKCPVAPLEFVFPRMTTSRAREERPREIVFVTPLDGAFTKPMASKRLGTLLTDKNITVETDFMIESVDQDAKVIRSYDEREVPYDQLVTVPLNMARDFVAASGLGDELNYVPVDKHTCRSTQYDNIWALGDASNIPTSKAGSVAHFSADVFVENSRGCRRVARSHTSSSGTPTASSNPVGARRCSSTSTTRPNPWAAPSHRPRSAR